MNHSFIIFILVMLFHMSMSGCAGIGLPVIGSSYTPSETMIGIPDYLIVKRGEVYRGGQPSSDGFRYLNRINIKTIIKLNSESLDDEKKQAEQLNINLVIARIEPSDLFHALDAPEHIEVNKAMRTLINQNNWPIYVHCENGWDRTGLIIAMFRVCHDNYSKDDAYNEMIMNGFSTSHRIFLRGIKTYWDKFNVKYCDTWRSD